ncbi:hypothetical protein LEP3755_03710 [Leptolyngbya sp. NIES-3755]|nr:hypothetical protein LEP3755_03710 [Leptolyngbya sp. NIES-3755]
MTTLLVHIPLMVDVLAQMKTEQFYECCEANSELWTLKNKKKPGLVMLNQDHRANRKAVMS